MKKCSKCGELKEFSDFCINRAKKDGFNFQCRNCKKKHNDSKKDITKIYNNEYYNINRDYFKKTNIKWNKLNPGHHNDYQKNKRENDHLYKLKQNMRSSILSSFKNYLNGSCIKSKCTEDILCCSFEEFKLHLESKFESWMTWNNRGYPKDGIFEFNKTWDIDHIIPLSSINTEEDIYKLNHFSNLQPLCSKVNREIKRNRLDYYN